jgi:hypothetical protein
MDLVHRTIVSLKKNNDDIRKDIVAVGTDYIGASAVIDFDSNGDIKGNRYNVCQFDLDSQTTYCLLVLVYRQLTMV